MMCDKEENMRQRSYGSDHVAEQEDATGNEEQLWGLPFVSL